MSFKASKEFMVGFLLENRDNISFKASKEFMVGFVSENHEISKQL